MARVRALAVRALALLALVLALAPPPARADEAPVAGELYMAPGDLPVEPVAEAELLWPRDELRGPVAPALRRYQLMSYVLAPADFVALRARCPQEELRARLACLDDAAVAEAADIRLSRALVELALRRLDVELPGRLTADEREAARLACAAPLGSWLACAELEGYNAPACTPARREIQACLTHDDVVVERYLDVVDEKKAAFGRARFATLAGVLAELTLVAAADAAAGCPQRDPDPLFACLQADPAAGPAARARARAIRDLSAALPSAPGFDPEAHRRATTALLLSVPNLEAILGACIGLQPELITAPPTGAAIGPAIERLYACVRRTGETDPIANPAYIEPARMQAWLAAARGKVVAALHDAELAHQRAASRRMLLAFALLAGLGFGGVLAMPWWRRGAAPSTRARLAAGAALAITLLALGGAVLAMRELQGRVAAGSTSPRMRIADATFAVLEQPAFIARFSEASRHRIDLVKRPLREIVRADRDEVARRYTGFALRLAIHWAGLLDEPELHARPGGLHGGAAASAGDHGAALRRTFGLYRGVDALLGLVPLLLALGAAVLYLLPLRDLLGGLATGADAAARRARGLVWAEARVVAGFLAAAVALLPVGGWLLARTVEPLIELVLSYALLTLAYAGRGEASTAVTVTSLVATMLALALCVALFLVAIALYLGALRKVLHALMHRGQRLADHRRFWIAGTLALAGLLAGPLAYATAVRWLLRGPLAPDRVAPGAADMLLVPLVALAALPLGLWALRGVQALRFLGRWPQASRAHTGAGPADAGGTSTLHPPARGSAAPGPPDPIDDGGPRL